MKAPRAKPHLILSDEPLKSGENYTAICGAQVHRANFVFMFDHVTGEGGRNGTFCYNQLTTCNKCTEGAGVQRYFYGMIDGESAKQGEHE